MESELASDLPRIQADPAQIRQVLINLVQNATEAIENRFTKEITEGQKGIVRIRTAVLRCDRYYLKQTIFGENRPEGEYVTLEVTDNGVGMDKATLDRIFEPFFTTHFTGRGLGLPAVHGIVQAHSGALKVYSELGQGTSFRILFPALPGPAPAVKPAKSASRGKSGGLALVVDDEELVREVACAILSECGFEPISAKDGQEAIEVFRRNADKISVVILDMTMPRMNGKEAFQAIRSIRPDVRVVISSGFSEKESIRQFQAGEIAAFLQKPYRMQDLLDAVHKALYA
jgi:CheY-like chemotaxis protein